MFNVGYYVVFTYLPTYFIKTLHFSKTTAFVSITVACVVAIVLILPLAALSDRIGRRPLLIAGTLAFAVLAYPLFLLLNSGSVAAAIAAHALLAAIESTYISVAVATGVELFATRVRYSGFSIGYNVCVAAIRRHHPVHGRLAHRQHRQQPGARVLCHCRGGGFAVHRADAAGVRGASAARRRRRLRSRPADAPGVHGVRPVTLGRPRGVRDRCGATRLGRAQADRGAGPHARPDPRGADRADLRGGAGLLAHPAVDQVVGTAAVDRSRNHRGRVRAVVATTLGRRTDLLLGAGAQRAGVDLARAERSGLPELSVPGLLGDPPARRLGGDLPDVGPRLSADVA